MGRFLVTLLLLMMVALRVHGAPVAYQLEADKSLVGFETDFGPDHITGTIPVATATLSLDFADVSACRVAVQLDVTEATASFPFAAQALKGPKILDSRSFPEISFTSTRVTRDGTGARVEGQMTIRGVTRPETLHAEIYRQAGTVAGDRSHLTILLTGAVSRAAYGAKGWADMVGDEVRLVITARIVAKG